MPESANLGMLQQLAMLAVARLGDDAYGARIRQELETVAARRVTISTAYVTLVRLEDQGLVRSVLADPSPGQGGTGKRQFALTDAGWEALRATRDSLSRMWDGVADPARSEPA